MEFLVLFFCYHCKLEASMGTCSMPHSGTPNGWGHRMLSVSAVAYSTVYVSRDTAQWLSNCHLAQKWLPFSGTMGLPMCLRGSCLGHQGTEIETGRCFPVPPLGKQWKSVPQSPLTQKFRTKARMGLWPGRMSPGTWRYQLLTPWKIVLTYSPVGGNCNHP